MFPSFHRSILPGLALALLSAPAAAAPYAAGVRYPLPTNDTDPRGAFRTHLRVVDDLNADGRRDLAIAVPQVAVQVLASGPSRTFASSSVGNAAASALATGDFDGDGDIDLVVADATAFRLLAGSGDGRFETRATVNLDVLGPHACVEDLVAGDFDGDGDLDVAVIDADPLNNFRFWNGGTGGSMLYRNSVAVAYGLGDGRFDTTRPRIGVTAYPQRLVAVDFERDGRPELVAVGAESKTVQVAFNNQTHPLGSQYRSVLLHASIEHADILDVAAGNLDGDTKPDLGVLFYSHDPDIDGRRYRLQSYRNTATGAQSFAYTSPSPAIAFDAAPGAVVLADVVGDGSVDAVVTTRRDDRPAVTIYPGDGAGGFGAPDALPERYAADDLVAADFDNDGKTDLAVVDRSRHAIVVYWHL